ncbi:protein FANTASTIC FOUR 3-like [Zingiber officinale]|uniref:FAF domain-containing protein n=1 Tax=Zingiber officinale TaxID=94328 RepID=A0A8J5GGA0_ZINOF|nr:protein FANTASTIC FOUR 3-like [Zingiber officinale]KAG6505295.1 hypothetical protein ZIOFF_037650 [Zingiber officinale]
MLNLCRAALTFLRLSGIDVEDGRRNDPRRRCRNIPHEYLDGLRIVVGDLLQSPNVVMSSAVRKPPRERVDAGSRGLHDIVYDEGLRMCTEDLGSESGDGRMEAEETEAPGSRSGTLPWRGLKEARKKPRPRPPIPPPLPWLANGRTRFLRAVREGGRIRMTEVLIEPPVEVLRATREGGRLRLDLVILSESEEKSFAGCKPVDEVRNGVTKIAEEEEEEDQEDGDDDAEEDAKTEKTTEEVEAEVRSPTAMVVIQTRSGEERRCQDMLSGYGVPTWWNHRSLMTA